MTLKATPYAAGIAALCSIAMLAYACEAEAGEGEFPNGVPGIAAVGVAELVELDAGTPCDGPDERLLEATARAARDAFEVKARRALVAMERARVLDRKADIVDLDAAEARLAGARAQARSDRDTAADAASAATARCVSLVRLREPAVGRAPPLAERAREREPLAQVRARLAAVPSRMLLGHIVPVTVALDSFK